MKAAEYALGEALALAAPIVGCPVDEARDYILFVFGKDDELHAGASEQLPPEIVPRILRDIADAMEAQL